ATHWTSCRTPAALGALVSLRPIAVHPEIRSTSSEMPVLHRFLMTFVSGGVKRKHRLRHITRVVDRFERCREAGAPIRCLWSANRPAPKPVRHREVPSH